MTKNKSAEELTAFEHVCVELMKGLLASARFQYEDVPALAKKAVQAAKALAEESAK